MALNFENVDLGGFGLKDDQLKANVSEAIKIDPDSHAKISNLSKESGVPEFAVKSNPEEIEQKLKLDRIDVDSLKANSPATSKFLTDDFNNAVIAQEDIGLDILQGIERTFSGLGKSIKLGFEKQATGALLAANEASSDRIDEIIPWSAMPMGMEMEAQRLSLEIASQMGVSTNEEYEALKQEGSDRLIEEIHKLDDLRQKSTPGDLNIVQEGVRAGIESLANMVPATLAMIGTQGRAAPLFMIGAQTYAGSYADARGEGLPVDQSRWFAAIDASIEVGTEILPLGAIEDIITGKSTGLKKDALKFMVREMGTEQLATVLQTTNSYIFGLDEELENAQSAAEMAEIQLRRQVVTAIATVVTGGIQASGASAVNKAINKLNGTERQKGVDSQKEQRAIDDISKNSQQSKLRERNSEIFKQFVRDADGDNATQVFLDGEQTQVFLQSKTRDEIENDPALKLLNNALRNSENTDQDLAIPVEEFSAELAPSDHFQQLRPHMTLSQDAVSPFRQEQHRQETESYVRELLSEADTNVSEFVEAQEIYSQVKDQLVDTGTVSPQSASILSQVVPAWASSRAKRLGKSVSDVFTESGLQIEGPQTGRLEDLESQLTQLPVAREQDFGEIQITEQVEVEGTGELVTVSQSAQKVFDQTVKRRDTILKLRDCLNAT